MDVLTTMALCVFAKGFKWQIEAKASYTKCNDDSKAKDLQNQLNASVQDLNGII